MAGMPFPPPKKLPQGDKTAKPATKVKVGPDENNATRIGGTTSAVAPFLRDRDGPAKDSASGKMAGKPKTSAPAAKHKMPSRKTIGAMRASIKKMG